MPERVRTAAELAAVDALVIPGGESTTIGQLVAEAGLIPPLRQFVSSGRPVWGTCAGLILLAAPAPDGGPAVGGLDVCVERNSFGRQVHSFEVDLDMPALGPPPFRAVFIRAPVIRAAGTSVEVLARLSDGSIVAVRSGRVLGTAFHPELTPDTRLHHFFLAAP